MRLAVLSDIHANLVALDAVLEDLSTQAAVDQTWVCGDIVGYGPQPNEVIDRLRQHDDLVRAFTENLCSGILNPEHSGQLGIPVTGRNAS